MNRNRMYDRSRKGYCWVQTTGYSADLYGRRVPTFTVSYDDGTELVGLTRSRLPNLLSVVELGRRVREACRTSIILAVWRLTQTKVLVLQGSSQDSSPSRFAGFEFTVCAGVDEPLSKPVASLKVEVDEYDRVAEIRGLPGAPEVIPFLFNRQYRVPVDPAVDAYGWAHDGVRDPFTGQDHSRWLRRAA